MTGDAPHGCWIGASKALGHNVPIRTVSAKNTTSGDKPIKLAKRDCAACAREGGGR